MPYKDEEKQKAFQKKRRRDRREWLWNYKKKLKCNRCGFDNPAALHFHHLRDKDKNINKMISQNSSIEAIMIEISKCEVLCANCHSIEHNDYPQPR